MMDLLQACAEAAPTQAPGAALSVDTEDRAGQVVIRIGCDGVAPTFAPTRLASVRRRLAEMGGQMSATTAALEISLPPTQDGAGG